MRFQTRLSLVISLLLAATVAVMSFIVISLGWAEMALTFQRAGAESTTIANRTIEYGLAIPDLALQRIKEQMLVSALITSELLPLAERQEPATPSQINEALNRVIKRSADYKGYPLVDEFWITDTEGKAYINTEGREFEFSPDPNRQPQASAFWKLLDPDAKPVLGDLLPRDMDHQPFLYVGVTGADKPRIVQVGVKEEHVNALRADFQVQKMVDMVMGNRNFEKILVVDDAGVVVTRAERKDADAAIFPTVPPSNSPKTF